MRTTQVVLVQYVNFLLTATVHMDTTAPANALSTTAQDKFSARTLLVLALSLF